MSSLFVFILNMVLVSYVLADPLPGVACACLGTDMDIQQNSYFKITDVPERCNVVIIGENYFNGNPSDEDTTAMVALKAAGKTIYMIYEYPEEENWGNIISDSNLLDAFIEPMLTFLQKNNIEGVILGYLKIQQGAIPDYATKINTLIDKIKECVPSIKVGLYLRGSDSYHFRNKRIFDFTLTNPTVDFYSVDLWTTGADCIPNLNKLGGRLPIRSDDIPVITLEEVCNEVNNSPLDKSKLVIYIYDLAVESEEIKTYSDYCSRNDGGVWCADTSQILYDRVIYLKQFFKGLMFAYLDLDDVEKTCGCGNFPVANTFIDAWEGKPLTSCAKLC